MRRGHKKTEFLLIFALIATIPVLFAFYHYYSLLQADFLSAQLKFEAPDQINLPTVSKEKLKAFGSSGFNHLFFLDNNIFEQLHVISFQKTSFLDLTASILRC